MQDTDLDLVKRLVDALESEDAFERRDAIERLAVVTQQRLDFRWGGDAAERRRGVRRWRRWIAKEERARHGQSVRTTIQILAGGQLDKEALEAALKGLAPAQKKALMAQVLAKVQAQHAAAPAAPPACEECERRPASAQVTELGPDGAYGCRYLCEVCAHRGGSG